MKMITVAGAHACGKTSVILKTAELLLKENCRPGVMKLDCISSEDDRIYSAAGITNVKYISGNICPDHYFADSISDIFQWGLKEKLDLLITESAGLCGRCSPHIRDIPAIRRIDRLLRHYRAPEDRAHAAVCGLHRRDEGISVPGGREVFFHNIRLANRKARVSFINGLTGHGAYRFLHPGKCGGAPSGR